MRGTYGLRKARKEHRCTGRSYHTIRVGDVYLYGACPPEHEMSRSRKKWEYIRACLRCANEYGMHTSDTRKQLEGMTDVHRPQQSEPVPTAGPDSLRTLPPPEPDAGIVGVPDVCAAG